MTLPRGIRNNNPGNIRPSGDEWQGANPGGDDPDFISFTAPVWGLRALMLLLVVYYRRHGLDTVRALINRWAPPAENDTGLYAAVVAKRLGISVDTIVSVDAKPVLIQLAQAITLQENGIPPATAPAAWYPVSLYAQAATLALDPVGKSALEQL